VRSVGYNQAKMAKELRDVDLDRTVLSNHSIQRESEYLSGSRQSLYYEHIESHDGDFPGGWWPMQTERKSHTGPQFRQAASITPFITFAPSKPFDSFQLGQCIFGQLDVPLWLEPCSLPASSSTFLDLVQLLLLLCLCILETPEAA
jgi:hypothetical protein